MLNDFTTGLRVLGWWVCVVVAVVATWPLLGLVLSIVSAGLATRYAKLDLTVKYGVISWEIVGSHDLHPLSDFVLWVVPSALWVLTLLRVAECW